MSQSTFTSKYKKLGGKTPARQLNPRPSRPIFPYVLRAIDAERFAATNADISNAINLIILMYRASYVGMYNVDYSIRDSRCAYVYLYVTSHVHMIQDFFQDFWESIAARERLEQWMAGLNRFTIRMCSIGGGPGTDILGFGFFLDHIRKCNYPSYVVAASVLDKYEQWESAARNLQRQLPLSTMIHWNYTKLNFYDEPMNAAAQAEIQSADLVTMVKFVSAVKSLSSDIASRQLKRTFSLMKPGALYFVLDNSGGGVTELVAIIARQNNLINLHNTSNEFYPVPQCEKDVLSRPFGTCPQLSCFVAFSLWQKQPLTSSPRHLTVDNRSMQQYLLPQQQSLQLLRLATFPTPVGNNPVTPLQGNNRNLTKPRIQPTSSIATNTVPPPVNYSSTLRTPSNIHASPSRMNNPSVPRSSFPPAATPSTTTKTYGTNVTIRPSNSYVNERVGTPSTQCRGLQANAIRNQNSYNVNLQQTVGRNPSSRMPNEQWYSRTQTRRNSIDGRTNADCCCIIL